MKKNLFPTILISILLAFWGLALFGYNYSEATTQGSSETAKPTAGNTLKNGLVGWWTMDGQDVNATQVLDKSISGNNGTRTSVTPVTGKIGQAMKFNGVNSTVAITQTAVSFPHSISLWFKVSIPTTSLIYFFGLNGGSFPGIQWRGNTNQILYRGANSGYQYTGTINKPVNTWHLYTVVVPSSSAALLDTYIDGVLSESTNLSTDAMASIGTSLNIGSLGSSFFPGNIDDVRIYNRVLSAAEVLALYKNGQSKTDSSSQAKPTAGNTLMNGLSLWLTFDGTDVTAVTTTDKSGNGKDGTRTSVTPIAGKIGQAMKFNGTAGNITVNGLATGDANSFGAWLKTTQSGFMNILDNQSVGVNVEGGINLFVNSGVAYPTCRWDPVGAVEVSILPSPVKNINDGKWHHVFCTKDANDFYAMYIDGVVRNSGTTVTADVSTTTPPFYIGSFVNAGFYWNGLMDDVRVYSRALSASEVTALYKYGQDKIASSLTAKPTAGDTLKNGLMGWWTFDGADVTAVTTSDKSGNGKDGTRILVTPVAGKIGQAMSFYGVASALNIPNVSGLTYPLSVSFWFYFNSTTINTIPFSLNNGSFPNIYWVAASDAFLFEGDGTGWKYSGVLNNKQNHWHLYTVTVTSTMAASINHYIDGILSNGGASAGPIVMAQPGTVWKIGNGVSGKFDDVRVYNRVLSAAEVLQLYKLGR